MILSRSALALALLIAAAPSATAKQSSLRVSEHNTGIFVRLRFCFVFHPAHANVSCISHCERLQARHLSDCPTDGTQKVGDCYLYDLTASTQTKILPGSTTSIDFLGKEYSIVCKKGAVDFLKFLYPDGNDGYTDQFDGPVYAMNAHAGDDYIICAPYISGSGKCQGEGSATCERKTVRVASYENTPNGGSSCDEVVFYLEPMACPTNGGGGDSSDSKDGSGSKSGGKKGDDSSDDSDSKDGSSYSKGGYKSGGSKEHDSSKSGGKGGGTFKGWGGKEGDSKGKSGHKMDLPGGKMFDHKSHTGGAKDGDSKNTKSDDKPCAKGKSG
jgi:hypothetical protein